MEPIDVGIVLGASGGIGSACIQKLARHSPFVLGVSRRTPALSVDTGRFKFCAADITTRLGRDAVLAAVRETTGRIRYLVVASGVPHRNQIEDDADADWVRVLATNLIGPCLLFSELLRLQWTRPAAVVFVGSLSARRALPRRSLYGASKAALEQFARVASVELAPRGISVNVASVGVVDTPFLTGDKEALDDYVARRVPIGRTGQADEIAEVIEFLTFGPAYVTGANIDVDGASGVNG
jgi:NAD(P)-dependent dehydrogenase (short-subunit alcohol dehydrogenase family)